MKKYLVWLILIGLVSGCKHKKVSLAGDAKVDIGDFIDFFPEVRLPFQITDSVFNREESDSSRIDYRVFTQFVADSVVGKRFGKGSKPDIYPIGKVKNGSKESYLFIKAVTSAREWVFLLCFDKSNKFAAAKPLFSSSSDYTNNMAFLDSKFTVRHERNGAEGELLYKKDTYIYLESGIFMLILTESNENPAKNRSILNPIDTLPRKHKYSGDYVQDKYNFISFRDGKDASHFRFFIHFEKDNGECKGELKGEAKLISQTVAHYASGTDPCLINFSFTEAKVSLKELEGCGSHRDIKCFFEGVYPKQKEVKKKMIKKRH
jgi:hypothetical protein